MMSAGDVLEHVVTQVSLFKPPQATIPHYVLYGYYEVPVSWPQAITYTVAFCLHS